MPDFDLKGTVHANVRELRRALGTPARELSRQELADLVAARHPSRKPNATTIGRWEDDTEPDFWSVLALADLAGVSFFTFALPEEAERRRRITALRRELTDNFDRRLRDLLERIRPEARDDVRPLVERLGKSVREAAASSTTEEQLRQVKAEWRTIREEIISRWGAAPDRLASAEDALRRVAEGGMPPLLEHDGAAPSAAEPDVDPQSVTRYEVKRRGRPADQVKIDEKRRPRGA